MAWQKTFLDKNRRWWLRKIARAQYYASATGNALAGYVAIGLSIAVGIAYIILVGAALNAQTAVYLIALILLSWLCAMVGYDKVMQAIAQFKR